MIFMCCKECHEKKYGESFIYEESDRVGTCIICGEQKPLIESKFPNPKDNYLVF